MKEYQKMISKVYQLKKMKNVFFSLNVLLNSPPENIGKHMILQRDVETEHWSQMG